MASVPGATRAGEPDPLLEWLNAAAQANGAHVVVEGNVVRVLDPTPDDPPVANPVANLQELQVYELDTVPSWLSNCDAPWTLCSMRGREEPWDPAKPGLLFLGQVGAPISQLANAEGHLGIFLALDGFPVQQTPDKAWTGSSHLVMGRFAGDMREPFEFGTAGSQFEPYQTRSRVFVQEGMPYFGILMQHGTDLPRMPLAFTGYGFAAGLPADYDVIGPLGGALTPIGTPPRLAFGQGPAPTPTPLATPTPVPVATAGSQSAGLQSAGPVASQGGPTTPVGTGSAAPWIALIAAGGLLALIGTFLLLRGRRPQGAPTGPGAVIGAPGVVAAPGGPVIAAVGGDPCPPLIEAARRARAACEEALKAAAAAADRAREAAAEVASRRADLETARKARQAAEQELARRQEDPDRSSWMSSGGRYEDSYDLKLKADARAAANAAHADAVKNAGSDAERGQAHRDWQAQLDHIDSQEGLDELRKNDREGRETWVKEAQEALEAARQAEADAQAAFDAASEAERAASQTASDARAKADGACAEAKAAEQAAMDAGCMPGATTPAGGADGPKPDKPEDPKPDEPKPVDPGPTDSGGGGGKPQQPDEPGKPQLPTPPTPPGGGTVGGGETPRKPRECEDGAEEWRFDTPPRPERFTVPAPGQKIQVSVSPSITNIDAWLERWAPFDAEGERSEVSAPGVPINVFKNIDATWPRDFRELERGNARHVEIEVLLPLQTVRVSCERLWRCQNGVWVRTSRCRAVEDDPEPAPKTLKFERDGAKLNEITVFAKQCIAQWKAAEAAKLELDSFRHRCCP